MRKKVPPSIQELIRHATQNAALYPRWEENSIRTAWYTLLPHTQGAIKKLWMRRRTLYLQINSPLLRHELHRQKQHLLPRLQAALQQQPTSHPLVAAIVFC